MKKRILLDNGNFAPFPEHLENEAIEKGQLPPKQEANAEIPTIPEKAQAVKRKHNAKAKVNNKKLEEKHALAKELAVE